MVIGETIHVVGDQQSQKWSALCEGKGDSGRKLMVGENWVFPNIKEKNLFVPALTQTH